jgi:hypothetical protein
VPGHRLDQSLDIRALSGGQRRYDRRIVHLAGYRGEHVAQEERNATMKHRSGLRAHPGALPKIKKRALVSGSIFAR